MTTGRVKRRWTDAEIDAIVLKQKVPKLANVEFVDLGQIKVPENVPAEFVGKPVKRAKSRERDFSPLFKMWGIPDPHVEFVFARPRRWRFDYAWPGRSLAVEIEGGLFANGGAGGRHNRGAGMREDMQKYNEATLRGWRVFRYMPEQSGDMIVMLRREFDL